jgi:hypothetical protein
MVGVRKNKLIPVGITKRINDSHLGGIGATPVITATSPTVSARSEICTAPVSILDGV